jgi:hypothetical protein
MSEAGLGGFFTGLGGSIERVEAKREEKQTALELADWQYQKQLALGRVLHKQAKEIAGLEGQASLETERFKDALKRPGILLQDITKRIEIVNSRLRGGDQWSITPSAEERKSLNEELNRLRTMHRSVQGFLASNQDMTPDILKKMWPILYGTETTSGGTEETTDATGSGGYFPGSEVSLGGMITQGSTGATASTSDGSTEKQTPPGLTGEQVLEDLDTAVNFLYDKISKGYHKFSEMDKKEIEQEILSYNEGQAAVEDVKEKKKLADKILGFLKDKLNKITGDEDTIQSQFEQSLETGAVDSEEENFLSSLREAEASGTFDVNDRSLADNDSSFLRSLVESGQGLIQKGKDFLSGGDEELDLSDPASSARQYGEVKGSDFIGSTAAIDALGEAGGPVGEPLSDDRAALMDSIKQMIHRAESTVGGYNAVAGTKGDSKLTSMTLGQIHKKYGDKAVGIGQFKRRYLLNNAKKYLNLDEAGLDNIVFDREVQEQFLEFGILESGFDAFADGTLSSDKFLKNLAVRWRGLPATIDQIKGDSSDEEGNVVQLPGSEAIEILNMWKEFSKE